MVNVFYGNMTSELEEFRRFLIDCGIPCRLIGAEDSPREFTSLVNIVERIHNTVPSSDAETVLVSNFDIEAFNVEKVRLYYRILDVLSVKYGINPDRIDAGSYHIFGDRITIKNRVVKQSHTQRLFMKHLIYNQSRWCSASELISYCSKHTITNHHVAVLMDELQRISLDAVGEKLIECKRGAGYKFTFK